jgi:Putative prokaryotic signal transducing protein
MRPAEPKVWPRRIDQPDPAAQAPPMADNDTLVVIASYLRPEEAGMLRGLLESAGLVAVVRDEVLSGVNPFLQSAIGGVKLAVRAADAIRAQEIIQSAGVLPGPGPAEPFEIPEDEWSRAAEPESRAAGSPRPSRQAWWRAGLIVVLIVLALLLSKYGLR